VGREGYWHLTCDKFLALYIFYSYSNYVFPVFLGGFLDKFHVFNLLKIRFSLKKGGVDLKIKPGEGGPLI